MRALELTSAESPYGGGVHARGKAGKPLPGGRLKLSLARRSEMKLHLFLPCSCFSMSSLFSRCSWW